MQVENLSFFISIPGISVLANPVKTTAGSKALAYQHPMGLLHGK